MTFIFSKTPEEFLMNLESIADTPLCATLNIIKKFEFIEIEKHLDIDKKLRYLYRSNILNVEIEIIYNPRTEFYYVVKKRYINPLNNELDTNRQPLPTLINYHFDIEEIDHKGIITSLHFVDSAPGVPINYFYNINGAHYSILYSKSNFGIKQYSIGESYSVINKTIDYIYYVFNTVFFLKDIVIHIPRVKEFSHWQLINLHKTLTSEEIKLLEIIAFE